MLPLGQAAKRTGAVVTVHPLATKAAEQAFERGGNAVDAGVASGIAINVTMPENTNLAASQRLSSITPKRMK